MSGESQHSADIFYQPFKKTTELVVGEEYRVVYLRKVKTQFGTKIRAYLDGFNYDLPQHFLIYLNKYDLDDLDYTNVRLHYVGRREDTYRTIIMNLKGLPARPTVPSERAEDSEQPPSPQPDLSTDLPPDLLTDQQPAPIETNPTPRRTTGRTIRATKRVIDSLDGNAQINIAGGSQLLTQKQRKTIPLAPKLSDSNTCTICRTKRLDTVIIPCGHRFCNDCALHSLSLNKCHLCRANVLNVVRTYDA